MMNLPRTNLVTLSFFEAALALSLLATGCTPATPDYVPIAGADGGGGATTGTGAQTGGSTGTSSDSSSTGGGGTATGTPISGPGASTGGATDGTTGVATDSTTGNDTTTTTGGTTDSTTGTTTTETTTGDAGAGPSGDASVPTASGDGGCNWVQNADGTWMFDPASANKIQLFDGSTLAGWHKENQPGVPIQWKLNGDGTMTVVPSGTGVATLVQSDQTFSDLCVHVEYMTPMYPSSVTGQLRGNSGVYLKSAYEMQILDSYGDPPDINTCGAVYSIAKPLVVACYMELVWNTYEIEFKGSIWNSATPPVKTQNAEFIKCALNGQIVQQDVTVNPAAGYTPAGIPDAPGPQPLGLQDHLDLVSFRNIWVRVPQY
jgi:hypothetical protein